MMNSYSKSTLHLLCIYVAALLLVLSKHVHAIDFRDPDGKQPFNYRRGTKDWGNLWPLCANGKEQSPINLTKDFERNTRAENSVFSGYGYQNKASPNVIVGDMLIEVTYDLGEF